MQLEPKASDFSPHDLERLAEFLGEDTDDPWDHEAALAFLAISQSETGAQAIQSTLESDNVRLAVAVLTAVAERWPDTRFRPSLERFARNATASRALRIPAALGLYRMGEREGFEILVGYAVGDGTGTHESRGGACGYLSQFTRAEDLDALVPLIGAGAYMSVAHRLIGEKGEALIPRLKQEFSGARHKDYVAFTLCQLGDREAFEHTKRVLLSYDETGERDKRVLLKNYDQTGERDYPIIWAIDALVGLYLSQPRRWSSEDLCPFFRDLLIQQMRQPRGGDPGLIGRVLVELRRCECRGDSTQQVLTQLAAHLERGPQWDDKEKTRLFSHLVQFRKWLTTSE